MKKIYTFFAAILLSAGLFLPQQASAQTPNKMSYQAVVRNSSDELVTNTTVGMQISILQGSVSGTVVYSEIQTPTTNTNGLISIEIGGGAGFSSIDWASNSYFIKTETDPTGGTNYTITGTSQLLSVPYALQAKTAETISGTITETDPIFGTAAASGINATDITNWNNKLETEVDGSVTNEIQALSLSHDTIFLSNGGFVKIPAGFDGQYSSLTGTPNNVSAFSNDAGYLVSFTETDPIWSASPSYGITNSHITNWNTAYGWGNHASAGYLTSSWAGSSNITTTGTISTGTWNGTTINSTYIGNLDATKITTGTFDNARINWAVPGNIGSTTPASGAFTSLSSNNGFTLSNGTVSIKPSGNGGANGQVLTTDGAGNATWQTPASTGRPIRTISTNTTLTAADEVVIVVGAVYATLPASPTNGQVLMICGANTGGGLITNGAPLRINGSDNSGSFTFSDLQNLIIIVYDSSSGKWMLNV